MKAYKPDAIIELTAKEVAALRDESKTTPEMLVGSNHPNGGYRTFREKVEHRAAELHYETERTVLVCDDNEGETVARYRGEGLEFDEEKED